MHIFLIGVISNLLYTSLYIYIRKLIFNVLVGKELLFLDIHVILFKL